jgi:hypothetical protein
MGKYIDWYLVELESRLQNSLRPDEVHDLVSQTAAHLADSSAQLEATGMSLKESELAALEKFGRVNRIAEEAVGSPGSRAAGRWIALVAYAFSAAAATWWYFGHGQTWPAIWVGVALFAVGVSMARKVMVRELSALSVLAFLGIALFFGVSYGSETNMTRPELLKRASALDEPVAGIPAEVQKFQSVLADFEQRPQGAKGFFYPDTPFYCEAPGLSSYPVAVHYGTTASHDFALQQWQLRSHLPAKLRDSQETLTNLQASLRRKAGAGVPESAASHALLALAWSTWPLFLGLALNTLLAPVSRLWTGRSLMHRKFA